MMNIKPLYKIFYIFFPVSLIFIGSMQYNSKKVRSKKHALQQQLEQLAEKAEAERRTVGIYKKNLSYLLNQLDNDIVSSSESVEWSMNKMREFFSKTTLFVGYEYVGSSTPFDMNIPMGLRNASAVKYPLLAPCIITLKIKGSLPKLARFFDRIDAQGEAFIVEEFNLKHIESTNEHYITARLAFPQFLYKKDSFEIKQFLEMDNIL